MTNEHLKRQIENMKYQIEIMSNAYHRNVMHTIKLNLHTSKLNKYTPHNLKLHRILIKIYHTINR